jgi:hypothetical protein
LSQPTVQREVSPAQTVETPVSEPDWSNPAHVQAVVDFYNSKLPPGAEPVGSLEAIQRFQKAQEILTGQPRLQPGEKVASRTAKIGDSVVEIKTIPDGSGVVENVVAPDGSKLGWLVNGAFVKGEAPTKPRSPQEVFGELEQITRTFDQVAGAKKIIASPSQPVGQGILSGGSWTARLFKTMLAKGGYTGPLDNQETIRQLGSQMVLDKMPLLKGPMSDKDRAFLERSVPALDNSEKVWTDYLNKWQFALKRSHDFLSGKPPSSIPLDGLTGDLGLGPEVNKPGTPAGAAGSTESRYRVEVSK